MGTVITIAYILSIHTGSLRFGGRRLVEFERQVMLIYLDELAVLLRDRLECLRRGMQVCRS